jgi:two-component system, NtrC family, sensor histidine kinase HupT/HoxJ
MIEITLIVSVIACIILIYTILTMAKGQEISKIMGILFTTLIIWCMGLLVQRIILKIDMYIDPIYCDYITYIGICFAPPIALLMSLAYSGSKISSKTKSLFFVIPVISLLVLWTNDFHHLFYVTYSVNFNEAVYGPMFNLNTGYSYIMMITFILIMSTSSVRKSGFFSMQTILIVVGSLVPLVVNILGTLRIIPISIYVTPISFVITLTCYALSIIKYKALNITPIAFRTVIDTMSDAFIVISDDGTIVDNNLTFENTFKGILTANKEDNLFKMIENSKLLDLKDLKKHIEESRKEKKIIKEEYHIINREFDKYFDVDIHPIKAKKNSEYIGTLLLFNDITQHKNDIKLIEDKQDVIVKQGQLVSIGELAGGVAHDINTPISAIKAGLQMLTEMYPSRDETEKELLFRMSNCTEKIIKIVNSMRNQIRNLGSDQKINFKVSEIINDIKIIAYNEIVKSKCELIVEIEDDLSVYGDPTKLGQVFTNLLLNAIQAYDGKGGKIEITVVKAPANKIMISVRDYAGGIPDRIKEFVFKNILTTKGTNGTGLGLYLAYSVIKGEFSGEITFESAQGEGTTFYIVLDRAKEEPKKETAQEIVQDIIQKVDRGI